jgi:DNA-binding NtrC family response regulator
MKPAPALLIIDDDADVLKAAAMALAAIGCEVETAPSPEALNDRLAARPYDAVLLDMNFAPGERDGQAGLGWLARIQAADPALSVVLMTTYGGVALAVEALKRGAVDFVLKPWRNDALVAAMRAAVERTRERRASTAALNLDELERRAIEKALQLHDGNISHAAATLGLTRPALYRRMARHGL